LKAEEINQLIKGTKREVYHSDDWKFFINAKEKRSKNTLAAKIGREITNFDFYGKTEEKIRKDFILKCDQTNCAVLTEEKKKKIFNFILQNRTEESQQPYPGMLHIPSEIKGIYNNTALIQDFKIFDEIEICHNGSSKRSSIKENEPRYIQKDLSGEGQQNQLYRLMQQTNKFNQAIDEIKSYITDLITSASHYEPMIVNTVLQYTYRIIDKNQITVIDTIKEVHRETYCYLEYKLNELQDKWNSNHNRTKRLEDRWNELWIFFQNVVEGVRGIKLFQLMIYEKLNNLWQDGFIERLVQDVAADVGKEKWIGNSDVYQAYIDNEKLRILKEHGIERLLEKTRSATSFYGECTRKFVQVHIDKYAEEKWSIFYENMMYVIMKAGDEAKNSSYDRLNIFLKTLRSPILPSLITSQLPNIVNNTVYGSADNQSQDIFDGVVRTLKSAIPEKPKSLLKKNESDMILNIIRENVPGDAAKPRCNHACKLCGAPCFKHTDHHGHHDFHHQPAGLAGYRSTDSQLIIHETCHESLKRNLKFSITDESGPYFPFTEFPKLFDYEIPVSASQRSILGEYLMAKYHENIADYYHVKQNPSVPFEYEQHTLEDVEDKIRRTMDQTG
jgi:hypothetical protein